MRGDRVRWDDGFQEHPNEHFTLTYEMEAFFLYFHFGLLV